MPITDLVEPADDQLLTIYNRRPEMFASDRYLLTNPDVMAATMASVVVSGELTTKHVYFRMAGTLVLSGGAAGNRGFTAVENDLAMTGELFANPNAATYARGQLFNDRMYTDQDPLGRHAAARHPRRRDRADTRTGSRSRAW